MLSINLVDILHRESEVISGIKTIPFAICCKIASDFGLKSREVEIIALKNDICPSRYQRNIGTIGIAGQLKLLSSRAAVVGCGGLGGWIIEMLARAGVGEIVMIDRDVFNEDNLNRQLFSTEANIGKPKSLAAAERVTVVNSAVDTIAHIISLDEKNGRELLEGSSVVIDALDNNKSRRILFEVCRNLGVPFIHGAIGGMFGQIGVLYPGDRSLWEGDDVPDKGIETEKGNTPFTPTFVASLEVSEAIKILSSLEKGLKGELLWFDLTNIELQRIKISRLDD
ncbi:MAG: HesA/MoeB/ThiF family protein [Synergistaceae bacterium]|nr:HesA/MoeB/ThiF family protein [Synergistaceae bacterium]